MKHYILVDVNKNYFNCGHYPEWVVEERPGECPVPANPQKVRAFASLEEARNKAQTLNTASSSNWRAFLDA